MPAALASFVCGLIFGAGLLISGMTQPEKVLGFLDIFGAWDATLAFVMAGAVAVAAIGFALARRSTSPAFAPRHIWPERRDIDAPLLAGAVVFGIGWVWSASARVRRWLISPGSVCRSQSSSLQCLSACSDMSCGNGGRRDRARSRVRSSPRAPMDSWWGRR